jgi:hypothetical protein
MLEFVFLVHTGPVVKIVNSVGDENGFVVVVGGFGRVGGDRVRRCWVKFDWYRVVDGWCGCRRRVEVWLGYWRIELSDGGAVMHVYERELLITETGDGLVVWVQEAISTISSLQIEGLRGLVLGGAGEMGLLGLWGRCM